jgi:hypothetical protein
MTAYLAVYRTLRGEEGVVIHAQSMAEAARQAKERISQIQDALSLKGVFLEQTAA